MFVQLAWQRCCASLAVLPRVPVQIGEMRCALLTASFVGREASTPSAEACRDRHLGAERTAWPSVMIEAACCVNMGCREATDMRLLPLWAETPNET